ncbi:hypothetical protein J5X07_10880 [Actinomyces bowdenii]|uniref:hypothetical protein n=1 Tax=Actinomyces bowdenii TaxID=131109 RepID=UPI001ABCBB9B|nr:hypothetical protein [Actinomyces bowdenii]MBO3725521.1 hypothetical protein [Actinomyces bowdenii]
MSIDTHLDATPSDIRSSATDIGTIKTHVDSCEDNLISGRMALYDLDGASAGGAVFAASRAITSCEDLVADLGSYQTALDDFASSMDGIKTSLADIRDRASEGGLIVSGEVINEPTSSFPDGPDKDDPQQVQQHHDEQAKITLYNALDTETSDIRTKEAEARQTFSDACAAITGQDNPLTRALLPSTSGGDWTAAASVAGWGISRTRNAATLAQGFGLHNGGARLEWTGPKGRPIAHHGASNGRPIGRIRHALSDSKLENWKLPTSAQGTTAAKVVNAARNAQPALKWAGRAGTAISFATSAYDQWQKDSHNPSLGEGEKVARAGGKGAATAGGAWAGATLGAKGGAAIGVCIGGPAGAAIGGVIGGIAGGIAGSFAGEALGDGLLGLFR